MLIETLKIAGLPGFTSDMGLTLSKLGKVTVFVGPNGSGKTTALSAITSLLSFIGSHKFDFSCKTTETKWTNWKSSTIKFVCRENSSMLDWGGNPTDFIEFEIVQTSNRIMISSMKSSGASIKIADPDSPFGNNPKIKSIAGEISTLDRQITDGNAHIAQLQASLKHSSATLTNRGIAKSGPNPQNIQTQITSQQSSNSQHQQKISSLRIELAAAEVEILNFIDESGSPVILTRTVLESFLSGSQFPAVKFIPSGQPVSESTESTIMRLAQSKLGVGAKTEPYQRAKKELGKLMQADIEIGGDEGAAKFLYVNCSDHKSLSKGSEVCLQFYTALSDLNPGDVVVWDEPENSLHPTRRVKMMDLFLGDNRQFIIATHATELTPVLNENCEVYRMTARATGDFSSPVELSATRTDSSRREAFAIAESLGIYPATTMFTANVVIWVEGPSDLLFWRKWISEHGKSFGLLEGFDYSFMMYGGSNIKYLDISDDPGFVPNFDLLSICRYPFVIVDSDFRTEPISGQEKQNLKENARALMPTFRT